MKGLLRRFLISVMALVVASKLLPALLISGGLKGILTAGLAFMVADMILVPFIRILLLPLNLLTLGLFTWLSNVLALYFLVSFLPTFQLLPYEFAGANFGWVIIPPAHLSQFQVVIVASFLIGVIIHFVSWLCK